jgi:hypothetical protein
MGIRLLFIILTLWAIYIIVRRYLARFSESDRRRENNAADNMVQCKVCNTYLPEAEALTKDGDFFCSEAHLIARHDKD